jgi:anti-anti-sigma regulatory factor
MSMSHKSKAMKVDAPSAEPAAGGNGLPDLEYVGKLFAQLDAKAPVATAANATAMSTVAADDDVVVPEECDVMTDEQDNALVVLPEQCLLRDAVEFKKRLLEKTGNDELCLDISAVERVDGAFMQVLVSLVKQRRDNGHADVQFMGVSAALHDAARVLGLLGCIELPAAAA